MIWAQLLAYITGTVDQELLLRNEYLAAENHILKAQIKGRLLLSQEEKTRRVKKLEWIEIARLADSSILSKLCSLKLPKHSQSSYHDSVNAV